MQEQEKVITDEQNDVNIENIQEEKIVQQDVSNEALGDGFFTFQNIYIIKDCIVKLKQQNVVFEKLEELEERCMNAITFFHSLYLNDIDVSEDRKTLHYKTFDQFVQLYADKDEFNNPILKEGRVVITSETNRKLFNNNITRINEDFKDVIEAMQTYDKVMQWTYSNYGLTQDMIDYILYGKPMEFSKGMFLEYNEVLSIIKENNDDDNKEADQD